ncbi:MAG TPA: hypothetical protein VFF64_12285 [Candidatus Eremiobacteraceae bacterium]|nr:hypothetical protein [Candidatus Eremiobacteraceae bacterium]
MAAICASDGAVVAVDFIASLACRVNPFRGFVVVWQILSALRETEFDLDRRSAGVSICIL